MNIMATGGHHAKIEFDAELNIYRGEILVLNGFADFYGKDQEELRVEFKKSLDVFLAFCNEKGIQPYTPFSGSCEGVTSPEETGFLLRSSANKKRLIAAVNQLCNGKVPENTED
jgi:predicted HicB family RNase H-like nuclease